MIEFYKKAESSDGLNPWCKPCVKSYQKGRRPQPVRQDRELLAARMLLALTGVGVDLDKAVAGARACAGLVC